MLAAALLLQAAAPIASPVDPCAWSLPGPEREMAGLYVDVFEGQAFYEGMTSVGEINRRTVPAWFDVENAVFPTGFRRPGQGHIYRVKAIGRESFPPATKVDPRRPCAPTASRKSNIVVSRFIEVDDLGPMSLPIPR